MESRRRNTDDSDNDASEIKKLYEIGETIVKAWDEAYIFQPGHHEERVVPKFILDEIHLGRELGQGSFCDVFEVSNIQLETLEKETKEVVAADSGLVNKGDVGLEHPHSISREYLSKNCRQNGIARYAIKKIRTDISQILQTRAMIDMACEIKLFTVLWHPHIGECPSES